MKAKRREETATMSVRERLAARSGRIHTMRTARRIGTLHQANVTLPESDEEIVLPRRRKRTSHRSRSKSGGRRRRGHSRGASARGRRQRSESSRSSDSSSNQLFRGGPGDVAGMTRAARQSAEKPALVLVETLVEISRVLPRTSPGATVSVAEMFKTLPSIFLPWFTLVLLPAINSQPGGQRSEREARTIVEVLDLLVAGNTLPAILILLGRLKAITSVTQADNGGWDLAKQHELVQSSGMGLLSQRDRQNAVLDFKLERRFREDTKRGAPLRGRERS